jgi:hypothetical protein
MTPESIIEIIGDVYEHEWFNLVITII